MDTQLQHFSGCSVAWGKPNRPCHCFIEIPLYGSNEENKLTADAIYFPQHINMAAAGSFSLIREEGWGAMSTSENLFYYGCGSRTYFYLVDFVHTRTHTHTGISRIAVSQYSPVASHSPALLRSHWWRQGSRGNAIGWALWLILLQAHKRLSRCREWEDGKHAHTYI